MPLPALRLAAIKDDPVAFSTAVEKYVQEMVLRGNAKNHIKKERLALKRAATVMGWHSLADVTSELVRGYMLRLTENQRKPKTIKLYRDTLDRFGKWSVKVGLAARNPVDGVPSPMVRPHQARVVPTEDELRRIIAAARADWRAKDLWLALLTMATTGLRVTECKMLEWSMLDLGASTIFLPANITKSKRDQRAFLTPELVTELSAHRAKGNGTGRVFVTGLKREQMLVYCRKAGVARVRGDQTLSYHSLRHFCSNRLMTTGFTPEERQQAMRHSNISLTAGTYTDPSQVTAGQRFRRLPPILVANRDGIDPEKSGRMVLTGDGSVRYEYSASLNDEGFMLPTQTHHEPSADAQSAASQPASEGWRSTTPEAWEAAAGRSQGVAQLGRASGLGPEGRAFNSRHPDSTGDNDPDPRRLVQMSRPGSDAVSVPANTERPTLEQVGRALEAQARAIEENGRALAMWMRAIGLLLLIAALWLSVRTWTKPATPELANTEVRSGK
jgi:integrase